jgi:trimeric autotransporter adhesin
MLPPRSLIVALALVLSAPLQAAPFVFRGQLDDGAAPAQGRYALRLTLYGAERGAVPLAGPLELLDVPLSAGRFAVDVDFGALPPLAQGWLEVAAKAEGEADYSLLGVRAPVDLKAGATCPAAWLLGGNAFTNPALDFLGTTDAQPLELRVNDVRVGRFENVPLPDTSISTANVMLGGPGNVVDLGVYGATVLGSGLPPGFSSPPAYPANYNYSNRVTDIYGSVLGGLGNVAGDGTGTLQSALGASVVGGVFNRASGHSSTVLGGTDNEAAGDQSVAGGTLSSARGLRSIALGSDNTAQGANSVALGGVNNVAEGTGSVALGGVSSSALRDGSIAIGTNLCAGAPYSWAGGNGAKVRPPSGTGSDAPGSGCDGVPNSSTVGGDFGTFIWADNGGGPFVSSGTNQFAIRARGGVRLNDDTSQYFGAATRQMLNLYDETYALGVQNSTLYQRSNAQFAWFRDGAHSDTALEPGSGGALLMTLGTNAGTPVGVARAQQFVNVSDRHAKTAFAPVDAVDVLARVLQLPLSEWSYKTAVGERHIGPMAQDFHAAFGLGGDDTTIATIDADGVALAAIQGLNARLEAEHAAQAAQIAELQRELARLRAQLTER